MLDSSVVNPVRYYPELTDGYDVTIEEEDSNVASSGACATRYVFNITLLLRP